MKNILIITTLYPNPYSKFDTPVIHYFAKEWAQLGHNVIVIHYQSTFSSVFYWIAKLFPKLVSKLISTDFFQTKKRIEDITFTKDGVIIYSFPIFKQLPHGRYSQKTILKHVAKIKDTLDNLNFVPDIITGHFYNPQIEIVSKLKNKFSNAHTCIVLHENPEIIKKKYDNDYEKYFKNIDNWGFRFLDIKKKFVNIFGANYKTFMCYSGIPEQFINTSTGHKDFKAGITKFCFIGMLIPLKRVKDTIVALDKTFPDKNFKFNVIGQGMEMENIKGLVTTLNLDSNINFTGKIGRDEVQQKLIDSDCYIMVSEAEAFGLVYLEAMSKGCITIGTKGQGIDGVIIHGVNGFLCESANPDKLADLLTHIQSLTTEELTIISQNAINTTINMTDRKVAQSYLDNIM